MEVLPAAIVNPGNLLEPSFPFSQKNESVLEKIEIAVGSIFTGAGIGTGTAVFLGYNIALWSGAGAAIGLIAGLILIAAFVKKTVVADQANVPLVNDFVTQKLMSEQEGKLGEIADILSKGVGQGSKNAKLSDEHLDQILQVIDHTRLTLTQQQHYQLLYRELERSLGQEKAQQVFQVKGLIDPLPLPLSASAIQHVIEKAQNYFHNQNIFQELRKQIAHPESVDKVLGQVDFQDYLTGQRRLSPETQKALSECVKNEQEFERLLAKVKDQAQHDLVLDEQLIEKKFDVGNYLKPLSPVQQQKRREELQKVINQAYINREIKQKAKWVTGETDERRLLSYLKFKVDAQSDYQNKDLVYSFLEEIVSLQLQKDVQTSSLPVLKETFKRCAFNARLKAAGLTTLLQVEKFHTMYSFFQTSKEELTKLQQGIGLTLPNNFPMKEHSLAVRSIKEDFEATKRVYTYRTLSEFFSNKHIKEKFQDENISQESLKEFITKNKKHLKSDDLRAKCVQALDVTGQSFLAHKIAFYNKWGSYIQAEMIQGFENASEALGEGVCWAICQRLRFLAQMLPDITPEELAEEIKITAKDRFQQGAYAIKFHFRDAKQHSKIPDFIKKEGFDEKRVFYLQYDANEPIFTQCFNKYQNKLVDSKGWIEIGLAMEEEGVTVGHAILVRFDTVKNRYWIIDPNAGFLCFEGMHTPEDAKKECINCLKDLFAAYYPLTYFITGDQLVK